MAEKWPHLLRAGSWEALPPRVHAALVRQLFGAPPSINIGEAFLVAVTGGLAAWRAADPWLAALTLATAGAILLLIPAGRRFQRERFEGGPSRLRQVERAFELHSWAISAGIGLMAARAILGSEDTLVHLMLIALALGATSTNIRYHFRPRITFGKTVAINGPLAVASLLTGNPYYFAFAFVAVVAAKLFFDICMQLYRGSIALLMTIQEKELLAAEVEAANADLQRRDSERQEAEATLRRLRAELVHVSRFSAMGAMASTLAHELNQPLTAVTNYVRGSRRLLETPTAAAMSEVAEAMEAAEAGALRAGQIIRRLRGLVYRGSAEMRPEDLEELIREACDIALADSQRLGVAHRLDLSPAARWGNVDHIQIQQVLINLIRNAVEAMHDSPRREIAITTRLLPDDLIEIGVADTGPGISDGKDGTLFTPFRSTKSEGLGIGLSISRTIVEAHGGKIRAANRGGGGAVFHFTLPLAIAPDLAEHEDLRAAS